MKLFERRLSVLVAMSATAVALAQGGAAAQFQISSTDNGSTWTRRKTNITDVRESTPSLIYDPKTGLVSNYYYQRGVKKLKRRVVDAAFIFDRPESWPEPEALNLSDVQGGFCEFLQIAWLGS